MTEMFGTWYVVPTPFDPNGEVDLPSLRRLIDAAVSWGVDGLTVMGVMSEATSLTGDERAAALGAILDSAAGRVPVAVGCSGASPHLVRQRIAQAAELGAAAAMVSAPPLLRNIDLLPRFYGAVAGRLPLVVQDEPAATGVLVPVTALLACLDAARATVVKLEDPPTPPKISALLKARPGLTVFGGLGGVSALSELGRGARGTMTGFAFPEVLRAVRLALEAGDAARAGAIFDHYLPLIQFEGQPVTGLAIRKEVLRRRGTIDCPATRTIAGGIDPVTAAELDGVLDRVGLIPSISPLEVSL
ncbi:MAG: dihydrodipicolinate synthase family protein [Bifidobacteriaceae bacterium]|jgi:4-hydroxy-tetrahydrodipicolinate synthase|nr:dihydrodipicolinate synthase family protein [Bifidobacteriaceae bacterium]